MFSLRQFCKIAKKCFKITLVLTSYLYYKSVCLKLRINFETSNLLLSFFDFLQFIYYALYTRIKIDN